VRRASFSDMRATTSVGPPAAKERLELSHVTETCAPIQYGISTLPHLSNELDFLYRHRYARGNDVVCTETAAYWNAYVMGTGVSVTCDNSKVPLPRVLQDAYARRIIAEKDARLIGQTLIVENTRGRRYDRRRGAWLAPAPDGYTLSVGQWDTRLEWRGLLAAIRCASRTSTRRIAHEQSVHPRHQQIRAG